MEAAELAAQIGDGIIATEPEPDSLAAFDAAGGSGPRFGQVTVCWAESEAAARATALQWWPNAGLRGTLNQELPLPSRFEQAAEMVARRGHRSRHRLWPRPRCASRQDPEIC